MSNIKEIIEQEIINLELDGLISSDGNCWCVLGDLFQCEGSKNILECQPAHKIICNCGLDCNFHIAKDE